MAATVLFGQRKFADCREMFNGKRFHLEAKGSVYAIYVRSMM